MISQGELEILQLRPIRVGSRQDEGVKESNDDLTKEKQMKKENSRNKGNFTVDICG
jgi:hypothetical protein